jgi:hypothetical protein
VNGTLKWAGYAVTVGLAVCAFVAGFRLFQGSSRFDAAPAQDVANLPLEQAAPEVVRLRPAFRDLAARARTAVAECRGRDARNDIPTVRGKALIWDVEADDVSPAHGRLPADVRAQGADGEVTVFLITRRDRKHTQNYSWGSPVGQKSAIRGYSVNTTLCVIGMPDKQPWGRTVCETPAPFVTTVLAGQTEVEGNWAATVATWVEDCVRGPDWRREQRAKAAEERRRQQQVRRTPPGQEGLVALADQAKPELRRCAAKGAATPPRPLPPRALIWAYEPKARVDSMHGVQHQLPADLRARPTDTDVVVFVPTGSNYVRGLGAGGRLERHDLTVAVVVLPGPRAVGEYTIEGNEYAASLPRNGSHPDNPHKTLARWVIEFMR